MPGTFSYASATNIVTVTGGTAGLAADRGHAAPLPAAHAPANNLPLACEVGSVTSRGESQDVWRIFS
jgi:hypothetical protein